VCRRLTDAARPLGAFFSNLLLQMNQNISLMEFPYKVQGSFVISLFYNYVVTVEVNTR
jgi:hypothetical protein